MNRAVRNIRIVFFCAIKLQSQNIHTHMNLAYIIYQYSLHPPIPHSFYLPFSISHPHMCSSSARGGRYDSVFYDNCTKGPSSVKSLGGKNIFPPPLSLPPSPLPPSPSPFPPQPSHTVHHTSHLTSLYSLQSSYLHTLCVSRCCHRTMDLELRRKRVGIY